MLQIIHGKSYGDLGGGDPIVTTLRGNTWSIGGSAGEVFKHSQPWSVAGSFKRLYVEILAPVENADLLSWSGTDFTLHINGVPTALTVTVPAHGTVAENGFQSSASNTLDSVVVAPGDTVALCRSPEGTIHGNTNAAYANMDWTLTFESDNEKESGYGAGAFGSAIGPGSTHYCALLNNQECAFVQVAAADTIPETDIHSIVPLACSLYRIDLHLSEPLGMGASMTCHVYLNGIKQDGSGGTIDTTFTISDLATEGTALFDLPMVPLDFVTLHRDSTTGSPSAPFITMGCALRATTDGQSALCFNSANGEPVNDGETDWAGSQRSGWAWTTSHSPTPEPSWRPARWPSTELLVSLPGAIDPYTLKGFCINLDHFPGVGNDYLFTTRKAFVDTTSVVTMTGNTDPGSRLLTDPMNAEVDYALVTDRLNIQVVGTSDPSGSHVGWSWLMVTDTTPIPPIVVTSYPIRRLRRFALPFDLNKWLFISRVELIMQAGNGLSGTAATVQGYNPIVMFRLSRDGGATWDDELQMATGKIGEYTARAYLNRLGRARNPVVELTSSDPVFVSWIDFTIDYAEGTS